MRGGRTRRGPPREMALRACSTNAASPYDSPSPTTPSSQTSWRTLRSANGSWTPMQLSSGGSSNATGVSRASRIFIRRHLVVLPRRGRSRGSSTVGRAGPTSGSTWGGRTPPTLLAAQPCGGLDQRHREPRGLVAQRHQGQVEAGQQPVLAASSPECSAWKTPWRSPARSSAPQRSSERRRWRHRPGPTPRRSACR